MKDLVRSLRSFSSTAAGIVSGLMLLATQAPAATLSYLSSTADLNLNSGPGTLGMYNWNANGANQLAQQWFWYRVGNSAEATIDTIGAPTISQPLPKLLTVTYANAALSVQIGYTMSGTTTPGILESIKISNLTAAPMDFHFFEYTDVNLANTPGGQAVSISSASGSTQVIQSYNGMLFNASVSPYAASHVQAANDGSTLASLNDLSSTILSDATSASGDVNWALQWDFTIGTGINNSVMLSHLMSVPEPSSLALLLVGMGGLLCWRKRS